MASEVLALTADMPALQLAPGEVLYGQGDDGSHSVAVLVDGTLRVELDDLTLSEIDAPGAFVGEIGALLGTPRTARVVATEQTTIRSIGNPDAFFASHPELAGRLHRLLAYLGDVRSQYSDAEGHLSMIDSVLGKLATRAPVEIEPGSDRSPDY